MNQVNAALQDANILVRVGSCPIKCHFATESRTGDVAGSLYR